MDFSCWYSSEAGQWLSQDPAGYVDSFSLYAFNGFDAVNFVDPWGLETTNLAGDNEKKRKHDFDEEEVEGEGGGRAKSPEPDRPQFGPIPEEPEGDSSKQAARAERAQERMLNYVSGRQPSGYGGTTQATVSASPTSPTIVLAASGSGGGYRPPQSGGPGSRPPPRRPRWERIPDLDPNTGKRTDSPPSRGPGPVLRQGPPIPGGPPVSSRGPKRTEFRNQQPELLELELFAARKAGVLPSFPATPGTPAFTKALEAEVVIWVVLPQGQLRISPQVVRGERITHAVLAGGRDVIAAGEARVGTGVGAPPFGVAINAQSGHYLHGLPASASQQSLQIGRAAFQSAGITFPSPAPPTPAR